MTLANGFREKGTATVSFPLVLAWLNSIMLMMIKKGPCKKRIFLNMNTVEYVLLLNLEQSTGRK